MDIRDDRKHHGRILAAPRLKTLQGLCDLSFGPIRKRDRRLRRERERRCGQGRKGQADHFHSDGSFIACARRPFNEP
jgi:hypothetical protein